MASGRIHEAHPVLPRMVPMDRAFKSEPTEQRGTIGRQIRNGVYRLTRSMYVHAHARVTSDSILLINRMDYDVTTNPIGGQPYERADHHHENRPRTQGPKPTRYWASLV